MNCQQAAEAELAERYVLGDLSDAEQEAFERHYFECARCFEDLESRPRARTAPGSLRPAPRVPGRGRTRLHRGRWVIANSVSSTNSSFSAFRCWRSAGSVTPWRDCG